MVYQAMPEVLIYSAMGMIMATAIAVLGGLLLWQRGPLYNIDQHDKPWMHRNLSPLLLIVLLATIGFFISLFTSMTLYEPLACLMAIDGAGGYLLWRTYLQRRRSSMGHCERCGYDLRGSLQFSRCPECGDSFRCQEEDEPGNSEGARTDKDTPD